MWKKCSFIILSIAALVCAQDTTGIQGRENKLSLGIAVGGLSGAAGLAARYWWDEWGGQVTILPVWSKSDSQTSATICSSVQALHRFNYEPPRLHEKGGYVHSLAYQYGGMGVVYHYNSSSEYTALISLGAGLGLETFWRNWRFASGVGVATYIFNGTHESQTTWILPTMDLSLTYGF